MTTRNITPCADNEGSIGTAALTWQNGRFYNLYCKGTPWVDVRAYGATGDGVTDDTAAIQTAISAVYAAGGGIVFFPIGTYLVDEILVYPKITYLGVFERYFGSILKLESGASGAGVLVSSAWRGNSATTSDPFIVRNLMIDGNSVAGKNGIIILNHNTLIDNVHVTGCGNNGIENRCTTANATEITGTQVEVRIQNSRIRDCGGHGFWSEGGAASSITTDGFFVNNIVDTITGNGVYIQNAAGWHIAGNHLYGIQKSGIVAEVCWATRITDNQVESYASSTTHAVYYGIYALCYGLGTSITHNHIWNNDAHSGGTAPRNMAAAASTGQTPVVTISDNEVYGNALDTGFYVDKGAGTAFLGSYHHNTAVNCLTAETVDPALLAQTAPTMTTTQRDALTPVNGMQIYNSTTAVFNFYENGAWVTK